MERFVDREAELGALERLWKDQGAQLIVVYGRRRVGKTALMLHFARQKPTVYWTASQSSSTYLLHGFSQALWRYANPQVPMESGFSFPSWEAAFRYAADLARITRLVLIIDGFPYAVEADSSLPSVLQAVWDHHLRQAQVFLMLAGSHLGMMERYVMAYRAPLYGRATGRLHLRPIGLEELRGLREKAERLTPRGWHVHLALFSRSGFAPTLVEEAERTGVILADLETVAVSSANLSG